MVCGCFLYSGKGQTTWGMAFYFSFSLYVSAQFIRHLMEEIFFPFPFPQNFHVTAATALQRKQISYVAYRDAQCFCAHLFFCFHLQALVSIQIWSGKNNFKPFFFLSGQTFGIDHGLSSELSFCIEAYETEFLLHVLGRTLWVLGKTGPWTRGWWNASFCGTRSPVLCLQEGVDFVNFV